jgi:hypothetical protein
MTSDSPHCFVSAFSRQAYYVCLQFGDSIKIGSGVILYCAPLSSLFADFTAS